MSGKGAWYVVVQALLMLAALLAPALGIRATSWPRAGSIVGGLLVVAGLGIVAVASVSLGRRNLSPFPKPRQDAALLQHGIFSVVRHPIYSGLTVFVLGWGLIWGSLATVVGSLVLLVFFDIKARREERWLRAKFPAYAAYRRNVKKLIPFVY